MEQKTLTPPVTAIDHHLGSLKSRVVLVEYGDFECSYCARAQLEVETLLKEMKTEGQEICFVFRQFPLAREVHPNAGFAALAAEAASEQNAFWSMHDLLFENSERLSPDTIFKLVKELNLDVEQFGSDLNRRAMAERVEADLASGQASGIPGTPTFFLNGIRFQGAATVASFKAAIRALAGSQRDESASPL